MGDRARFSTIQDSTFELRRLARAKIEAGLLPDTEIAGGLQHSQGEHLEPCAICDHDIASDERRFRLVSSCALDPCQLHELCYLALFTEVLERQ
jgi:hypothetical protein